jgi:G3E family GTPase
MLFTDYPPIMSKARYLMIGGFLGAGKTTSVARLAQKLTASGLKVGLITNDQGSELVDTAMLRSRGFATEEIPGGCFCCRFNSLVDAANKLTAASRPDVFIAEPVGSCTDLVATVTYPLRRMYGKDFSIAPLSVLVDPVRAQRIFGLAEGGKFSEKVLYIYRKQLEEADLIVINKRELLDAGALAVLKAKLEQEFPKAEVIAVSARNGDGLDEWFARITTGEQPGGEAMEVDYEVYADGEALLGWLNCTVAMKSTTDFDGNAAIRAIAQRTQHLLNAASAEIAHLKMTLSPDEGLGDIAVINLVRNDFVPELSQELPEAIRGGQLIINCRAEAAPDTLLAAVNRALADTAPQFPGLTLKLEHSEHFRPGKPQPTHRVVSIQ